MPRGKKISSEEAVVEKTIGAFAGATKTLKKTTTEEIKADLQEKPHEEEPIKPMGSGSKDSRERLPKIIVTRYDKTGQMITKTYTCLNIRVDENTSTQLSGGQPTTAKTVMHISLDADVVEVTP